MPGNRDDELRDEAPRTDLPPEREPHDEGYLGTEEEGVTPEREEGGDDEAGAARGAAEEAAGGDREID